jgi:formate dehydrogenase major subunit
VTDAVRFTLDGREVEAVAGETIFDVARRLGHDLPHLCHLPAPGYRPDGNCRACVVEIEGERALAASCVRKPSPGLKVHAESERARTARRLVIELLIADQPARADAHDPGSRLWREADRQGLAASRFPRTERPEPQDLSHPAMAVNLDACIQCTLCVRACREVQVNDVIGMARRGFSETVVFDFADPMGDSTCVACGECVQACPTGALMPKAHVDAEQRYANAPDREVASVCPYCGVGCQIAFAVKDERIVSVSGRDGPSNQGRLCVKGRFGFDYLTHPHRLTVPLIRRDGVPKGDVAVDPGAPWTHFRAASWDEALDRAAAGLRRAADERGPHAVAGFGSAKGSNEEAYLFQKLMRTAFRSNNVDHCTRLCHASSVAALMEDLGSAAVTAPFRAAEDADVILVVGANPTENHPVAATYFKQAVKRGAKLVVIDPRATGLARHATHRLQFTPGRDVALLNALLHVIVDEGLVDAQFIAARTEGYEDIVRSVADFAPERMAEVCGVPAETLREVARLYARAERAVIFWGMGVSQHVHGTDNARCLIALALVTGQIGRKGTGLHPLRGQNNVQGASDAGLIPMVFPDYRPVEDAEARALFEAYWGAPLDPVRGLTVVEITEAIRAGKIRALYVMGENPAMSDPDVAHARAALAALDHLVVQDIFLTETAAYADVVLPASAWPEKDGTVTNTNRQVQMGRIAVPLPGEARPDWWIIQEIARRAGLDWSYAHPREIFTEMAACMPSLANISWDRVEREGAVTYPTDGPAEPGHDIVFAEHFPTPSGLARLVPAGFGPPAEEPDADYPFVLTTGRQLEHWHTGAMTRRAAVLDELEPEPTVQIAPADLDRLGLEPGDLVAVATRRGRVTLKARADDAVPAGMLFIPFCYAEAAANLLTTPQLDPFGKIPEFKYCAARLGAA